MDRDIYKTALMNSLKEIRNICPSVKCSFLFTENGVLVAEEGQTDLKVMEKTVSLFQNVVEKISIIGDLDNFVIHGENGIVYISRANNMYLAIATSKDADMIYLHSVTRVIIPTVLRLLESILPIPLKFESSLELIVDNLSGFRGRFSGDTVEIDKENLNNWSQLFEGKDISEVEVETFSGKQANYRVRAIEDSDLEGKRLIRIPEKASKALQVKKEELVRVKPIAP